MLQFQKSLESNSLSIFRIPVNYTKAVQKVKQKKIEDHKEKEESESSVQVVLLDNNPEYKTPEEKLTHIHNDNLTPDARQEEETKSTSKGHPRNLPAITALKPEICKEVAEVPSSCSVITKTETTVSKRSKNPTQPAHPTINENQQQSYPSQENQLGERKTAQKRFNVPVTFRHLDNMDFSVNKRYQVTMGRPSVRGRPGQFVPVNQPVICSAETYTPVKKTNITISLPPMSHQTEKQLLKVFFEISKLHGCDVSVDRKEIAMRDEGRISNLTYYNGSSQQPTKAAGIQERKSQQLTNKQQKSTPTKPTFPKLRTLQSKLHTLGTQLHPLEVGKSLPQKQTLCQNSSSDSDSSLPLYPEVIMQNSPSNQV
ncbi:uncharacterized protein LOC135109686 [Scylla paramamosain]|uniref:uncharacterized protein LOC135109686 n=1 Tax=Scylla paramamosain TaxID=85552 RepID=UPI00308393DA